MEETILSELEGGSVLDEFYEQTKSKFVQPLNFGVLDKKNLFDFKWLIETTKDDYSHLSIEKEEIELYISQDLIPKLFNKNGSPGFPLYTPSRIGFIKELQLEWGYDLKKIKQITDFEERMIDQIYTTDKLKYCDLSPLDFYVNYLNERFKSNLNKLKKIEEFSEQEKVKKENVNLEKELRAFKRKKFDDLTDKEKERLNKDVFQLKWCDELVRLELLNFDRVKIFSGFSPNVSIGKRMLGWDSVPQDSDFYSDKYSDGFFYKYKSGNRLFYFSDWDYPGKEVLEGIDFFSTPEFIIEYGDKKEIQIKIRDPQRVDAKYLRRIEKVYKFFRDRLGTKKSKWGSKSGIRKLKEERDKLLRERYQALRKEKPGTKADFLLDELLEEIKTKFDEISDERAKRIIYTKKI